MSWLKEVENTLAKQKAEQTIRERAERDRERERIEGWKVFADQTLGRLLTYWSNFEIDAILKDVRNVVWPGLKIEQKIVVPMKGKKTLNFFQTTMEEKEKVRNLFGSYTKTSTFEGWWSYGSIKGRRLSDVVVGVADSRYRAGDVEDPYIEGTVYDSWSWTERNYEDEVERTVVATEFGIRLFEGKVEVMVGEKDSGTRFQLDELSADSDALKRRIAQILEGEVGNPKFTR